MTVVEKLEHKVSPWLQILITVLLAISLHGLNNLNAKFDAQTEQINELRRIMHNVGERVTANETAIQIYHGRKSERSPHRE